MSPQNKLAICIGLGSCFGIVLGQTIFDEVGLGLTIGMGVGLTIGVVWRKSARKKSEDRTPN